MLFCCLSDNIMKQIYSKYTKSITCFKAKDGSSKSIEKNRSRNSKRLLEQICRHKQDDDIAAFRILFEKYKYWTKGEKFRHQLFLLYKGYQLTLP